MTLNLRAPGRYGMDELILHKGNRSALEAIKEELSKDRGFGKPMIVQGPSGSGKTHVLRACAGLINDSLTEERDKAVYASFKSDSGAEDRVEEILRRNDDGPDKPFALTLDDIDHVGEEREGDLWTIFNKASRSSSPLIMSVARAPEMIFANNMHLRTRINAAILLPLDPPDDQTRLLIVDKLIRDRNVRVSHDVCRYLVNHFSRNMKEMENLIRRVDHYSMKRKRRITIPLIKELLSEEGPDGDTGD